MMSGEEKHMDPKTKSAAEYAKKKIKDLELKTVIIKSKIKRAREDLETENARRQKAKACYNIDTELNQEDAEELSALEYDLESAENELIIYKYFADHNRK